MRVASPLQAASAKRQASVASTANGLLQRKCACGSSKSPLGEKCDECRSGNLQRKLAIGASNDPLEREADRIADQVLAAPARRAVSGAPPRIRRFLGQSNGQMDAAPASVGDALASPGRPLEPALRQDMEQRFGHDFSRVRVHSGAGAEQSARDVSAHAYTAGHNIVFGAGRFAPGTHEGRRLIAHELTHVVQQSGLRPAHGQPRLQRQPEGAQEAKAEKKPKFVGCEDAQQLLLKDGMAHAHMLASEAVKVLDTGLTSVGVTAALTTHFGNVSDKTKAVIVERYKHIRDNLVGKTYTCAATRKTKRTGQTSVDLCGEASCPGTTVTVFPTFGSKGCPAGQTLLHESAHSAGACADVLSGKGYPPAKAENNAWSYENFAVDALKGFKQEVTIERIEHGR